MFIIGLLLGLFVGATAGVVIIGLCVAAGKGDFERLHWTEGGNGSHWEGCTDVHWDCRIAQLEAELARRDEIIKRLKEDAESLAVYAVMFAHGNEDYRCTMCGNLVDKGEEHKSDCPITLHRALMNELEEG